MTTPAGLSPTTITRLTATWEAEYHAWRRRDLHDRRVRTLPEYGGLSRRDVDQMDQGEGVGTVCIYQASSPEAIRTHASRAGLPVDEIVKVADVGEEIVVSATAR